MNISSEEVAFLGRNRGIGIHIWQAHYKASRATNSLFGYDVHHNNEADAIRHCYGAALLTRDLGPFPDGVATAKEFLDLHEARLVLFQDNKSGFSVPVVFRCGVAALDKGTTLACALRLAAKHHRDAES